MYRRGVNLPGGTKMTSKVAVVPIEGDYSKSLEKAIELIGGIDDLNTKRRKVAIKVGIFNPPSHHHSSVGMVDAIIKGFDKAPKIFIIESNNYRGKALDRLQVFKELFDERVIPFNTSDDPDAKKLKIANEEMALSKAMLKPNVFVSTHVLRTFERGCVLKNLFGCTPMVEKAQFHKNEIFPKLLADIYEAIGGIDLAVVDGTYLHHAASTKKVRADLMIVGRDAIAVDTVVATLSGLKMQKLGFLQEFASRDLGEADMANIEIVGMPLEELMSKFKQLRKELKASRRKKG
jgi:uncharacterized protein (DUF362 family)